MVFSVKIVLLDKINTYFYFYLKYFTIFSPQVLYVDSEFIKQKIRLIVYYRKLKPSFINKN